MLDIQKRKQMEEEQAREERQRMFGGERMRSRSNESYGGNRSQYLRNLDSKPPMREFATI